MTPSIKVSVIVPIYNVSKFIERCAQSLFAQTFTDIEFIFVNDCTPDNSIELLNNVIAKFPNRKANIKIVTHETNRGLAAARNTGLSIAQGEFIQHVDSDDFIEPEMIETMYEIAQKEGADIVVTDLIFEWGKIKKACLQTFTADTRQFTKWLLNGTILPGVVNKLTRKDLYTSKNISFVENLNTGEDYVTTPRLAYFAKKIAKTPNPMYHYSQTNPTAYTKMRGQKYIDNLVQALTILSDFFGSKIDGDDYQQSLLQGKLKKKITLLAEVPKELRPQVLVLFPETDTNVPQEMLTLHEKNTLYLSNNKYLLDIYLGIYKILFNFVQLVKGRR